MKTTILIMLLLLNVIFAFITSKYVALSNAFAAGMVVSALIYNWKNNE